MPLEQGIESESFKALLDEAPEVLDGIVFGRVGDVIYRVQLYLLKLLCNEFTVMHLKVVKE
jgi:hypothetical protein